MTGLYNITFDIESSKSGIYYGDLKEILSRLSRGVASTEYIKVEKVKVKTIDMNQPKKSVGFYCYNDREMQKDLGFCEKGSASNYYVYFPEEIKTPFIYMRHELCENETIVFEYEGRNLLGTIMWFDYDNQVIKVKNESIMYSVKLEDIRHVYKIS